MEKSCELEKRILETLKDRIQEVQGNVDFRWKNQVRLELL
ncbi:unnamed protein product [Acanthoscelides obtectus]|uniref:Uncharacterized protein n=1 Tax=Acanthoscelides obtectus TaxID=200917 RepID=A0A9P0LLS2_ACAOB|nr:unnamed protein product [Acanthoscelides obtectus]CAK1624270.1 hypothetical protein AOBTE_LOCUS2458 [Acanthoscelides obtectus]